MSFESRLASAIAVLFEEVTVDPIDEIRGHFTSSILKEWIHANSIGIPAAKCALSYDIDKRIVSAFLLSEDDSFLYSPAGKRFAAVFSAKTMDDEMRKIFQSDKIVVLLLH